MEQEARFKLDAGPEPLECPVGGCGEPGGRILGVEVRRDTPGVEESVTIAFVCARGHRWVLSIDERAGELVYEASGKTVA